MAPPDPVASDPAGVAIVPVDAANWRQVAALAVAPDQRAYVAEPSYYLALCCYGDAGWSPLAVEVEHRVVGFLMWAIDPQDGACWLGGIIVDQEWQGRGVGGEAVRLALSRLAWEHGVRRFALSYLPSNERARRLYARLGFRESGELEGDEVVARLTLAPSRQLPGSG